MSNPYCNICTKYQNLVSTMDQRITLSEEEQKKATLTAANIAALQKAIEIKNERNRFYTSQWMNCKHKKNEKIVKTVIEKSSEDSDDWLKYLYDKYFFIQLKDFCEIRDKFGKQFAIGANSEITDDVFSNEQFLNHMGNHVVHASFVTMNEKAKMYKDLIDYITEKERERNPLFCNKLNDFCDFKVTYNKFFRGPLRTKVSVQPVNNISPFTLREIAADRVLDCQSKLSLATLDYLYNMFSSIPVYITCGYELCRKVFDLKSIIKNYITRRLNSKPQFKDQFLLLSTNYYHGLHQQRRPFCTKCTRMPKDCKCPLCQFLKRNALCTMKTQLSGHQVGCTHGSNRVFSTN